MSSPHSTRTEIARRFLILVATATLVSAAIAHEDHEEPDTAGKSGSSQTTVALDSTYAIINSGYERVKPIFRDGCFDCHSTHTDFPWYHSLPIIGRWMDGHVAEAREHLDFTPGFPFGGHHTRQADNLLRIKREIQSGAMPLLSYRLMHWGAAPNDEEKDSIFAWIDRSLVLLAAHGLYPFNNPANVPAAK